jgi:hypothetical protein
LGACIALRRIPREVRCDRPEVGVHGTTDFTWPEDTYVQDLIPNYILAVLLGPLAAGEPDWPPSWPPRSDRKEGGTRRDEKQLAAAVALGNISESQWNTLTEGAKDLTQRPGFRSTVQLIARAMEYSDVLSDDDVAALLGPARLAGLNITYPHPQETTA